MDLRKRYLKAPSSMDHLVNHGHDTPCHGSPKEIVHNMQHLINLVADLTHFEVSQSRVTCVNNSITSLSRLQSLNMHGCTVRADWDNWHIDKLDAS